MTNDDQRPQDDENVDPQDDQSQADELQNEQPSGEQPESSTDGDTVAPDDEAKVDSDQMSTVDGDDFDSILPNEIIRTVEIPPEEEAGIAAADQTGTIDEIPEGIAADEVIEIEAEDLVEEVTAQEQGTLDGPEFIASESGIQQSEPPQEGVFDARSTVPEAEDLSDLIDADSSAGMETIDGVEEILEPSAGMETIDGVEEVVDAAAGMETIDGVEEVFNADVEESSGKETIDGPASGASLLAGDESAGMETIDGLPTDAPVDIRGTVPDAEVLKELQSEEDSANAEEPVGKQTLDDIPIESAEGAAGKQTLDDISLDGSSEELASEEKPSILGEADLTGMNTIDDIEISPAGKQTLDDISVDPTAEELASEEESSILGEADVTGMNTIDDIEITPAGMQTLDDVSAEDLGEEISQTLDDIPLEDVQEELASEEKPSILGAADVTEMNTVDDVTAFSDIAADDEMETIDIPVEEAGSILASDETGTVDDIPDGVLDMQPPTPSKPLILGPASESLPADEKGTVPDTGAVAETSPEDGAGDSGVGLATSASDSHDPEEVSLDEQAVEDTVDGSKVGQTLEDVSAKAPDFSEPTDGKSETVDETTGMHTLDDVGPVDDPNAISRTLDSDEFSAVVLEDGSRSDEGSRIDQTLDSVDLPLDELAASAERADRIDQTLDSVDIPADQDISATLDSVDDLDAGNEQHVAGDDVNQTVDAFDSPQGAEKLTIDQTLDSSNFPQIPTGGEDPPSLAEGRIDQTLDSVDLPAEEEGGESDTMRDRAISQTLDSVDESPSDSMAGGGIGATLDSGEIPAATSARIRATWEGTVGDATPMTSIKAELQQRQSEDETSLIIQRRKFQQEAGATRGLIDYQVVKQLGMGGMGVVYAAKQTSIDRTVALKMLKAETARQKVQRNKFLSEAVVTGELEHPNIVPIYDLGMNDEGSLYYAMKRVIGTPWDEAVKEKGLGENIEILMKVADAISFAHARKVIHRDLKPENVMLGGYGEVLVMDWGLAIPSDGRKIGGIKQSVSMGGTPAYMAPEMAAGPFERISIRSDIYLLGAMLFEIITGKPPHTGKDVMKCLFAAAKNEIQPTEEKGELLGIACQAMASDPDDRHESVQVFQDAIRQYLSHSESIKLSDRASEDLAEARQTKNYEDFARARFGFMEAYDLWSGNSKAEAGVAETSLLYAENALNKGDYDLAVGLLDQKRPDHKKVVEKVQLAQQERDQRQARLKSLRRWTRIGAIAFIAVVLVFSGVAGLLAYRANQSAIAAQKSADIAEKEKEAAKEAEKQTKVALGEAETQRKAAVVAQTQAVEAANEAKKQEELALEQKTLADEAAAEAKKQEELALEQKTLADKAAAEAKKQEALALEQKTKADTAAAEAKKQEALALVEKKKADDAAAAALIAQQAATEAADEAKKQQALAEAALAQANRDQYVALIGLANAKIEENAFGQARAILDQIETNENLRKERNWEWGRLKYLCQQSVVEFPPADAASFELESVAFLPTAPGETPSRFVTGGANQHAYIWNIDEPGADPVLIPAGATRVDAVAVAPSAAGSESSIVTAGDNPIGSVKIWSPSSFAAPVLTLQAHEVRIHSLDVSADGKFLVTAAEDGGVKVWDFKTGAQVGPEYRGHRGAVFSARFSPDSRRFVTAGEDGFAIVWTADENRAAPTFKVSPPFRGHFGPVYTAAFNHDGTQVASGGEDKRVLLWNPQQLTSFDYQSAIRAFNSGRKIETAQKGSDYQELEGDSIDDRHTAAVHSVKFSQDGSRIVTAGHDNTVKVWRTGSLALYKTLRGHGNPVRSCDISPSADRIVSVGYDDTQQARVWDIEQYSALAILGSQELGAHRGPVLAASFSANAQAQAAPGQINAGANPLETIQVVTASADRTARTWTFRRAVKKNAVEGSKEEIWNLEETSSVEHKEGHRFLASNVVFYPEIAGQPSRLVTGAGDNSVRIWDMKKKVEVALLAGAGREGIVALSGDGQIVATGSDGLIEVEREPGKTYDPKLYEEVDGKLLRRTGSNGFGFKLWSPDGELYGEVQGHDGEVTALAFFSTPAKPRLLVVGDVTGDVQLWDADAVVKSLEAGKTPSAVLSLQPRPHRGRIVEMIVLPNNRLASAGVDGQAKITDLRTGQVLVTMPHPSAVTAIESNPAGDLLLTGCEDSKIRMWKPDGSLVWTYDLTEQEVFARDPSAAELNLGAIVSSPVTSAKKEPKPPLVRSISVSQDGASAIATLSAGEIRLNTKQVIRFYGNQVVRFNVSEQEPSSVRTYRGKREFLDARFSPRGKPGERVIAAVGGDEAMLWNETDDGPVGDLNPHGSVLAARFNAAGNRFVTASDDGSARIWSVATHLAVLKLEGHQGTVYSAVFSHDDTHVLTAGADGSAKIWDAATGELLRSIPEQQADRTGAIRSAVFSSTSKYVLTAGVDKKARVWDAATGEFLFEVTHEKVRHVAGLLFASFSHDDSQIVTASQDNTAIVWNIDMANRTVTGDPQVLTGHTAPVTSASFSPDDTRLLTASEDFTARLWNVEQGKELMTLKGHEQEVTDVGFSEVGNGRYVVTASKDGSAIVWMAENWTVAPAAAVAPQAAAKPPATVAVKN